MILPTMTLEEIRKEIEKDFPILYRKMNYVANDLKKKLSKDTKRKGFIEFFDYYSKYKNHWIYKIEITKTTFFNLAMLLYHDDKGFAGISVTHEMNIIYHTGHFFKRYNERRKLGLNSTTDIVKAFLTENTICQFNELEEIEPGIFKTFCIIPTGIMLGIFNRPIMLIKANTFLTNDMLFKNQIELKAQIKDELEKYKLTSHDLH